MMVIFMPSYVHFYESASIWSLSLFWELAVWRVNCIN